MLRRMSARLFHEWKAYEELEPFEMERADLRAGSIVQILMNVNRKKGSKAYNLDEATLKFGDAPRGRRKKDWREMKATAQFIVAANRSEQPRRKRGT